jgi:hypothetical protein
MIFQKRSFLLVLFILYSLSVDAVPFPGKQIIDGKEVKGKTVVVPAGEASRGDVIVNGGEAGKAPKMDDGMRGDIIVDGKGTVPTVPEGFRGDIIVKGNATVPKLPDGFHGNIIHVADGAKPSTSKPRTADIVGDVHTKTKPEPKKKSK